MNFQNFLVKEYPLKDFVDEFIEVHFSPDWEYGTEQLQKKFLRDQTVSFAELIEKGVAKRYGAFLGSKLIADLGFFWNDMFIRFNNVATHYNFRRQGACSPLVSHVCSEIVKTGKEIVMQADINYHAFKIYESIGFKEKDRVISLEWRDKTRFGLPVF